MSSLTVDDFKIGKDSRKGPSVADADRLIECTNAFITRGKIPRKRPGSTLDAALEAGSVGLTAANGKLNTFYGKGSLAHTDPDYVANLVNATVEHTVFSGAGIDDCNAQGEFTELSSSLFDVEIDTIKNFAITIFADSTVNPGTATKVTAVGHTFANTENLEIAGTTSYNGNHVISDVGTDIFDIPIPFVADDATGTAENSTWRWQQDGGGFSAGVLIIPVTPILLADGVFITFDSAGNGRDAADAWSFSGLFYDSLTKIHWGDVFAGFLYVSAEYDTGLIRHHYLDGSSNTVIKDVNCPHSIGVIKIASKIFAVNGDTVNFSATNKPRDWTTTNDAGFLSTGLKQRNAENALALGQFGKNGLVVIHEDGAQLWTVDPNPTLNTWDKNLDGFQSRFPRSVKDFAGDLFMLSDAGVRSVSEIVFTENIQEQDVGSPIDKEIQAVLLDSSDVLAARFNKGGQYWLVIDGAVFVYTFSRGQKISAWSEYSYPWTIEYMEEFKGKLYLREGNNVYLVDDSVYQDNGVSFEALIQTAFLNAKAPGVNKQWWGIDLIVTGTATISFRYDPNQILSETSEFTLSGDTTPDQVTPVEVLSPSLSTIFKNSANEEFQLDSFTLYYNELGV